MSLNSARASDPNTPRVSTAAGVKICLLLLLLTGRGWVGLACASAGAEIFLRLKER